MGEVTPGPPLLQLAGPFSSAPGEGACSLLGALMGAEGAGEARAPPLLACCSTLTGVVVLESFLASASAGTGMILQWRKALVEVKMNLVN